MTEDGAVEIGKRSRGTPRVANRLLRRVRDFAQVRADGHIDLAVARAALEMLDVDEYGRDEMDARVLSRSRPFADGTLLCHVSVCDTASLVVSGPATETT